MRLTEISYRLGLASQERMEKLQLKKQHLAEVMQILEQTSVEPAEVNDYLNSVYSSPLSSRQKLAQLLLRPGVDIRSMLPFVDSLREKLSSYTADVTEQAEISIKYDVYIEKEKELVSKMSQLENLSIPDNFNYDKLVSLSNEARQKFMKIQPRTLGQASRISGVNPSDVQILMLYMGR
jgi:tRNA uridine 5-carboxymethylaminomethyl modification enzyme